MDLSPEPGAAEVAATGTHALDEPTAGGRAIRAAGMRAASFGVAAALAAITVPLVIRHLGVADFGRYSAVVALLAIAGGLSEAGLGPVGVREYVALEGAARTRFMRNLYGLRLALTVAAVLVVVGFSVVAGYSDAQVAGAALAGIGLLIQVSHVTFCVPVYADIRLGRQVAAEVTGHIALFLMVVSVVLAGGGLVVLLAVTVPAGLVLLLTTLAVVPSVRPIRPAFEVASWMGILRETLPVGINTAVHTVYFRSVIIFMSITAASLETGYFATAFRLTEVIITVPVLLVGTTFPVLVRAAQTDVERLRYATQRLFDTGVVLGLWVSGVVALGAPLAVDILAGSSGRPAVPVLRIMAFTILLAFLSSTFGSVTVALRRHRALVASSGTAVVVTMGLAVALVPAHGARGGAVAALAGEASLVAALWIAVHRSGPGVAPAVRDLPRAVAAASVAAALALAAPGPPLVAVAVFTVAYGVLAVAAGAIPAELKPALLGRT